MKCVAAFNRWGEGERKHLWKLSTIFSCPRSSFLVRWSNMRASTSDSMKQLLYWGKPRLGSQSLPTHSWFISPQARIYHRGRPKNINNARYISQLYFSSFIARCILCLQIQTSGINNKGLGQFMKLSLVLLDQH